MGGRLPAPNNPNSYLGFPSGFAKEPPYPWWNPHHPEVSSLLFPAGAVDTVAKEPGRQRQWKIRPSCRAEKGKGCHHLGHRRRDALSSCCPADSASFTSSRSGGRHPLLVPRVWTASGLSRVSPPDWGPTQPHKSRSGLWPKEQASIFSEANPEVRDDGHLAPWVSAPTSAAS